MESKIKSLPQSGWILESVSDTGEYASFCEWCGTQLRYFHKIAHEKIIKKYEVGCCCAERLTGDSVRPRAEEKKLKAKSKKLTTWVKSPKWKRTDKGNIYRKDDSVLIYKKGSYFQLKIGDIWGKKTFQTEESAKLAAFSYLY